MKSVKNILALAVTSMVALASCQKATDFQAQHAVDLVNPAKSEGYYQRLREYRATDHQIAFSYYSGWTGKGSSMQSSMMGLPDSTDLISIWGGWQNPTDAQLKDLRDAQQKKGLKAMICFLVLELGDGKVAPEPTQEQLNSLKKDENGRVVESWAHKYFGWQDGNTAEAKAARRAAVVKYANAICDKIYQYNYDGFDMDAEPSYAHPFSTTYELWRTDVENGEPTLMTLFIETVGKRIGPKAETEEGRKKIFAIDGEVDALHVNQIGYFNYFIVQAYNQPTAATNRHFTSAINNYRNAMPVEEICKKTIFVVDFESGAPNGGNPRGQILSFALQNPVVDGVTYRKGGIGAFRVDLEYAATVPDEVNGIDMKGVQGQPYPWFRRAIQLMNPVIY